MLKCNLKNANDNCDIQDVYKEKIEKIKTETDNEILLLKEMYEKRISSLEKIILSLKKIIFFKKYNFFY